LFFFGHDLELLSLYLLLGLFRISKSKENLSI
jgi:hypothetical protein